MVQGGAAGFSALIPGRESSEGGGGCCLDPAHGWLVCWAGGTKWYFLDGNGRLWFLGHSTSSRPLRDKQVVPF